MYAATSIDIITPILITIIVAPFMTIVSTFVVLKTQEPAPDKKDRQTILNQILFDLCVIAIVISALYGIQTYNPFHWHNPNNDMVQIIAGIMSLPWVGLLLVNINKLMKIRK